MFMKQIFVKLQFVMTLNEALLSMIHGHLWPFTLQMKKSEAKICIPILSFSNVLFSD